MLDIKAIRKHNVLLLEGELGDGGRSKLARKVGSSQSYLSQCVGKAGLRSIGDEMARRMEGAMGKPYGWMDQSHIEDERMVIVRRIYDELLVLPPAKLDAVAILLDIGLSGDNKKKKEKKRAATVTKPKGNGLRGSA